ncbi:hypothetical protein [Amycolatopsis panacis]|uniref:hypothetical protein n=1 Tax=Amycolatopsis panacis TaxID=2340917 RepID=UPI001313EC23|nr:hypothetical protein [Amycolatopsis panacis]
MVAVIHGEDLTELLDITDLHGRARRLDTRSPGAPEPEPKAESLIGEFPTRAEPLK